MSNIQMANSLKTTAITIVWDVEDVWNLNFDGASSPHFCLSQNNLHLRARGYEGSIGIYICRDDKNFHVLRVFCRVSLIGHHGQERLLEEKEIVTKKSKDQVLIASLMKSDLQRYQSEILQDNTLTISCTVSSSYKLNLMKRDKTETEKPVMRFETLSSDLQQLYDTHLYCDAVLTAEDEEFPVHRSILSARSPKLADMFNSVTSNDFTRFNGVTFPIYGMKASTLRNILYYIYNDKVQDLTADTAEDLYLAAERFSLQQLKRSCQKVLQTGLTKQNIFSIADLAYTYDDWFLKQAVEQFIVENTDKIINSTEWREFSSEKYVFANEILISVLLRRQKNDTY